MKVRPATSADVPALLRIKQRLTFADPVRGGFLLGCDERGYRARLETGRVFVLEGTEVVGFAITLTPRALMASELWAAKERLRWTSGEPRGLTEVGFFDQLAVLPEARRRPALGLAFTALWDLLPECRHVMTSTVAAPVHNAAAVSFIRGIGGERVAQLEEDYPRLGRLTSDLWLVSSARARETVGAAASRAARWVGGLLDTRKTVAPRPALTNAMG
jgi:hypothetical protein